MTGLLPILADVEDWVQLLPLAIPVLLWLIVSVAEAVKNSAKRPPGQRSRAQLPRGPSRPPPRRSAPPPRPAPVPRSKVPTMRAPPPVPQAPVPRRPAPPRPGKRKAPPPVRQAEELEVILEPEVSRSGSTPPITDAQPPQAPAAPTTAQQLRRWLNPRTLRSEFILTEVFHPPVALREPREWD